MNENTEGQRRHGRPRKNLEDKLSKVLTTDRQKAFLRNRLSGLNKRQAAIQAGYAPSTASIMAKRLTDKITCNRIFIEEAQRQGLTVEAIIGEIKRGMTEATLPQYPGHPDNFNRRGYTDMALRMYGGYAPNKLDIRKDTTEVGLKITIEDQIEADKILAECMKMEKIDNDEIISSELQDDAVIKPEEEES
jgi:hypothetical protein